MTPSKIHMQEMELKRTGSGKETVAGLFFSLVCCVNILGYHQTKIHKQSF